MVFLSYAREDAMYADEVAGVLDRLNVKYFRDIKDIEWGKDVEQEVGRALMDAIAVLVVISSASLKSQWVPYEIGYAKALRKRILPYLPDKTVNPPDFIARLNCVSDLKQIERTFKTPWATQSLISGSGKDNARLEEHYLEWWEHQNERRNPESVRFEGLEFWVDRGVFSPSLRLTYSTYFTSTFLRGLNEKRVLDIGTGCGVLAILAAKRHAKSVVAIDVDHAAVENARKNVKIHRLGHKIKVYHGDLFSNKPKLFADGPKYDVIVSNLPIAVRLPSWNHLHIQNLRKLLVRWARSLPEYLADDGVAYLSWASFGDQKILADVFFECDYSVREFKETTFGITWQSFELKLPKPNNIESE